MGALMGSAVTVTVMGSSTLQSAPAPATSALGIYLHRISIDPVGRNRYLPPAEGQRRPRPELPVNLPGDYRLSAPYLVKTLRLLPLDVQPDGPLVRTLVFPAAVGQESAA